MENILVAKGLEEVPAHAITASLVGLNELRIGSAHIGMLNLEHGFKLMGASTPPQTPREGWQVCIDSVTTSLKSIAKSINLERHV